MRYVSAVLIFLLVLTGCGGPKEGRVLDKRWKPDLSYWGTQVSCSGSPQRCSTVPHWYYNPPVWYLILETPDGDVKEKSVKKKVYYKINIGDYYTEA